jgi:Zn-dependent protease with chaperone function
MTFARRMLPLLCLALLLTGLTPRLSFAQAAPAQAAPTRTVPAPTAAPPAPTAGVQAYNLPPDKLAKAITLNRIRIALEIAGSLWGMAVLWILLATRWAAGLAAWTQRVLRRRWMQGLLFFAAFLVISSLADLPLDAIGNAVSRHYGISVQGWGSWLGDAAKGLGLSVLFGAPVLLLFNWIVRRWPRRYWLGLWGATLPLLVFIIFVAPLLAPIFYTFEPLAQNHSALVAELEKVVARTGTNIPPARMFLMKASEKSNGLNAYVSGIGSTKRVVVWDTTAGRIPNDEVLFIFGHESGHYVLNHIPKQLVGTAAGLFFVFWACAGFAGWLARRYGVRWQLDETAPLASRPGILVLLLAISVAGFILQPADNTFSRYFEHQADVYGQEAIHGLVADPQKTAVSAFNHLGEAWLEDPNPSSFIEFWGYSHPSVQHRAEFALHYDPWANGGRGRFFEK